MVVHCAEDHAEAERWDLEYWQAMGPEGRLDAFVALRDDVALVEKARRTDGNIPR